MNDSVLADLALDFSLLSLLAIVQFFQARLSQGLATRLDFRQTVSRLLRRRFERRRKTEGGRLSQRG